MTDISDNSHVSNSHSPTVGERLRLAREAKKITISEVVAQLRLTKENVVYLESDQWDKLHGRPYARGYFSSYVNFLGLPHTEMLALFNMEYTSKEPSIDGFRRAENDEQGETAWFKSLLLIAVLAAITWFAYQYWLEVNELTTLADTASPTLSSMKDEQTYNDSFSTSIVEPLPVETEQISPVEPEAIESLVEASVMEQQIEVSDIVEEDNLLETSLSDVIDNTDLVQPELLTSEEVEQNTNEQEVVTEGKMLVIAFAKNCWVEISNRNNKKLLHKMVLANETLELAGEWPLQVLLGNASAVKVSYNNANFDIAPYIRSNVARFSVGESSE